MYEAGIEGTGSLIFSSSIERIKMQYQIFNLDCRDVMSLYLEDNSVDAIVTDPPYGLSFMGKDWDHGVPGIEFWKEMLRVLKPGGHLLSFGGSRTYHRMASAVEDAGFEIRDQIMWVYGCLDEQTQIATADGVKPYHKTKIGDSVLCYNPCSNEYSYQPILDIVEYDYSDTAYRLVGDFGEQVVSRNHRVIIERCGKEVFEFAENIALEQQAHVPILESLSELQQAIRNAQQDASCPQQDLQQRMCECTNRHSEQPDDTVGATQRRNDKVFGLQQGSVETECLVKEGINPSLQPKVQRYASRKGMGDTCIQREVELETGIGGCIQEAHDGGNKPVMERWVDLPEPQGCVCGSTDKICSVPHGVSADGKDGRVRDGASPSCGNRSCTDADANRSCASHKPQCNGQPDSQSDAICNEHTPQVVRAWGGHRTSLVRIVPFRYTGKVWCLRVPTGAFVAVRNGVAFPTGNSGFPKSLDVSKAIDNAAGAEREKVLVPSKPGNVATRGTGPIDMQSGFTDISEPITGAARQWQGWGTALKPAHEPLVLARKPLIGTVAANVLAHGTGGLNIDGCRVPGVLEGDPMRFAKTNGGEFVAKFDSTPVVRSEGRWPANLIHDGSDEVVSCFPDSKGQQGALTGDEPSSKTVNTFGEFAGRTPSSPRNDTGSAARFFYAAKASKKDRGDGNDHPTVKPTDLMAYLCRLVTPAGGVVLDPFMGSGSTGKAAIREGFRFIGAEREAAYYAIAEARLKAAAV